MRRSSLPDATASEGYRTLLTVSDRIFCSTAFTYSPLLKIPISNSSDARAEYSRRKYTVRPSWLTIGISCGTPISSCQSSHMGL